MTAWKSQCLAMVAPSLSLLQWKQGSNRDVSLHPHCLPFSLQPYFVSLAKSFHRGFQSCIELMADSSTLTGLRPRVKSTTPQLQSYSMRTIMLSPAHSAEDLQGILNAFAKVYRALGQKLNIKKTKVLHQYPPYQPAIQPNIKVDNTTLEYVDHFPYLGSIISSKADIDSEVNHRLSCASGAYARLRRRVFDDRDLSAQTKLLVYRAVILPTLLYGAESWTTYSRHLRAMEQYHQRLLRKILRISWKDRRTNISILEEANMTSITTTVMQYQLRWTGHVMRMPNTHLPKQILYSQLKEGSRATGGQKKRYKDNIKANLKKFHITSSNWEHIALDRSSWKKSVQDGAANHEIEPHRDAEIKWQLRKEKDKKAPPLSTLTSLSCPYCTKVCGSRIGLYSLLKSHK